MSTKAERVVNELFNAYQSTPSVLPPAYQTLINERGLERVICDYIAGMTDRFATEEYSRMFQPDVLP